MNLAGLVTLVLVAVLFCAGCDNSVTTKPPPPTAVEEHPYLDHALPKLATVKLWLGEKELETEVAMTHTEVSTGMMYRTNVLENEAMLFVFGRPHQASFYMRNVPIPLSCAYIDSEGTILEIRDMKPLDETPIEAASENIQYVLEMNQGWFERNKVGTGSMMRTERGSLPDTFFKRR